MAEEKPSQPQSTDSTDVARVFAEIALRSKHLVETRLAEQARHAGEEPTDELGVGKAFSELAGKLMSDPFKLAEMSMRMWQDYVTLWQNMFTNTMHNERTLVLILLLLLSASILWNRYLFTPPREPARQHIYYSYREHVPIITLLQELFASGILNPKRF